MPPFDMRAIELADAPVLAALHAASFTADGAVHHGTQDRWDAATFATLLAMPGALGFLAFLRPKATGLAAELTADGDMAPAMLGFVLGRIAADEAEIITIATLPEWRGRGVGRALLGHLAETLYRSGARALFLEVAETNAPARSLYARAGFLKAGRRPGYYRNPEGVTDALLLRKDLS